MANEVRTIHFVGVSVCALLRTSELNPLPGDISGNTLNGRILRILILRRTPRSMAPWRALQMLLPSSLPSRPVLPYLVTMRDGCGGGSARTDVTNVVTGQRLVGNSGEEVGL